MTRHELVNNFGSSIEKERIKLGYSQKKMAEALDMSLSSYKRIINGETSKINIFTVYHMYELTKKLGFELCGDTSPQLSVYNSLTKLTDAQLRFITSVIDFEAEFAQDLMASENAEDYITVLVPTGNMMDGMIYDSCSLEKVNVAPYRKRYGNRIDFGVRVTSDHLNPVYQLGDILLVCQQPIRDGDTGIFIDKSTGLLYTRKFYQTSPCRMEPLNNFGQTFYIDTRNESDVSRWMKLGYVVTKMRT